MKVDIEQMLLNITGILSNNKPWVIHMSSEDLANIQTALAFAANRFHRTSPVLSKQFSSTYQSINSLVSNAGKEPT